MPRISPHGTQLRTHVSMPGRAMQIWLHGPSPEWTNAFGGSRRSCVPQPSSAGATPSS